MTFKISEKSQRDFDRTLREYAQYSSRTIPVIVNTKAFYIARRAVAETPLADAGKIREFMSPRNGALLGKIINKRMGKRGLKGLYGAEMAKAIITMKAARMRSRAFIKSGWLFAVKALEPYAERVGRKPSLGRGKPKTYGQAKGSAKPASSFSAWRCRAQIVNTAMARWDKKEGVAKIAEPALQRAFDFERQSMLDYIEGKLKKGAQKLGIKTR